MRLTFTPHPMTDRPAELCRQYVAGNDPVSGTPMLDEIHDGLTRPLSTADSKGGFLKREPRTRFLPTDTPENLMAYFHEHGFTDGNPVILPTDEKVAEMLDATSHDPNEWVGQMRAAPPYEAWYYNIEMVAINAVMAGAEPEYFPVILAIASKGVTAMFSSTSSFARMVVVNGPIAKEIGMNAGIGALSPVNRPNSTIGRAWTLISRNLGNSGVPGESYLASMGNPLCYSNMCFPENEAMLPEGWVPLHVQKGFDQNESVVSIFSGWTVANVATYLSMPVHEIIRGWLEHHFSFGNTSSTLILDPIVAADIVSAGYNTKKDFAKYLTDNTGTPGWTYWAQNNNALKKAEAGEEPYAGWLKNGKEAVVPVSRYQRRFRNQMDFISTDDTNDSGTSIEIVVTGGGTNTFWAGGDFAYVGSASVDYWR